MNNRLLAGFSCHVRSTSIFVAASILFAMNAWSVEPIKESFRLWADDPSLDERFVGFDIDTTTPGIEILVGNETEETRAPISNMVTGVLRFRIRVLSEDGSTTIGDFPVLGIVSLPYPDPGNPQFQEQGANTTSYQGGEDGFGFTIPSGTNATDARQMVIERVGFPLGFGIAQTSGGTVRSLILGIGFDLVYANNLDGTVDVSQFAFASYDLSTRTLLCQIWIRGQDSIGWGLQTDMSGVSNYLSAGGRATEDEIRISRESDFSGFDRREFQFYDPRSCANLSRIVVNPPSI